MAYLDEGDDALEPVGLGLDFAADHHLREEVLRLGLSQLQQLRHPRETHAPVVPRHHVNVLQERTERHVNVLSENGTAPQCSVRERDITSMFCQELIL